MDRKLFFERMMTTYDPSMAPFVPGMEKIIVFDVKCYSFSVMTYPRFQDFSAMRAETTA